MPDTMNTDDFRSFLEDWLARTGRSQNQLALDMGIGQGLISRWLHPDPRRRTRPTSGSLERLAKITGKPYGDLMVMAGWWPKPSPAADPILDAESDSPSLLAAIAILREGFHNMEDRVDERDIRLTLTQELWQHPKRRSGRPRKESPPSLGNDERLDKHMKDNVRRKLLSIS